MKRRKLPIGHSDFRRVIEEDFYYVDKSLLIQELLDSGALVTIIPRPRRFGKTLNLNMLRCFFEKPEDPGENLFKNLAIEKAGPEYKAHQEKHPVIYLTFKDVKYNDWPRCRGKIERDIASLYRTHKGLLNSGKLDADEKERFRSLMTEKASHELYADSLKILTEYLYRVHQSKVIILIDEYDVPILQGYAEGFYKEAVEFCKAFLSGGLKDNPYLEKAVLTGILRVAKESIFSDLNNLKVYTLLNHQYADKFGLLEEEVIEMLEYYNIGFEADHVKDWYNGYICGETQIYNPWSIICYAEDPKDGLRPYWINTSSNTLVKQILSRGDKKVKDDLKELLEGNTITKQVNENIVFPEIESDANHLFSFLLFSGYLKPVKTYRKERKTYCDLVIPNEEVKYLYENIISSWFSQTINNDRMEMMLRALTTGDVDLFSEIFADYVELSISYFNVNSDDAERVYQAFTLGLVLYLSKDYVITSEEPSGYGRADLMLTPKDKTKRGIVFEFKKASKRKKESLETAVKLAKAQIKKMDYKKKLEAHGVKSITALAIGFKGNECLVEEV